MESKSFVSLVSAQKAKLVETIVRKQYAAQALIWSPYGSAGQQKSLRDAGYHLSYLIEAIATNSPDLFFDYVAWVKVLFNKLGFPETVLPTTLKITAEVLLEAYGPHGAALLDQYIRNALNKLDQIPDSPPLFVRSNLPLGGLAKDYMDALLSGDRRKASDLILHAVHTGIAIKEIYLHVFQPVQREIGRLWQTNQISVAQEHFCTAATQLVMSQLYAEIFAVDRIGRKFVGLSVDGELHEIGIRMVADFFEMSGWDTYFLGANTPLPGILQTIAEQTPDVLGISATITYHLPKVDEIIRHIRHQFGADAPAILVGGYPFIVDQNLWKNIGADGFGMDAEAAVETAVKLIAA